MGVCRSASRQCLEPSRADPGFRYRRLRRDAWKPVAELLACLRDIHRRPRHHGPARPRLVHALADDRGNRFGRHGDHHRSRRRPARLPARFPNRRRLFLPARRHRHADSRRPRRLPADRSRRHGHGLQCQRHTELHPGHQRQPHHRRLHERSADQPDPFIGPVDHHRLQRRRPDRVGDRFRRAQHHVHLRCGESAPDRCDGFQRPDDELHLQHKQRFARLRKMP